MDARTLKAGDRIVSQFVGAGVVTATAPIEGRTALAFTARWDCDGEVTNHRSDRDGDAFERETPPA